MRAIAHAVVRAAAVASLALTAATVAVTASAEEGQVKMTTELVTAPADDKPQQLKFTNELVKGKKTWLPGTASVTGGGKVEIVLVNTLKEPHGFSAPGLTEEIVVGGNETKTVTVDAAKAGAYKFHCQLHPAHVGGSIEVK